MLQTFAPRRPSHNLRQIRTYQVAALMQAVCIALRTVAVELFFPLRHVSLAPVLLDQPVDVIAALAVAFGALDAEHVELAFDVTEHEVRFGAWSPAYCGVTTWRQRPGGKPSSIFGRNGIGITRLHCQCVMQVPARRMEPAGRGARRVLKSSPRQVDVGVKRVLDLGVSVVVPAPDANAPPVFGGQPYFSISLWT